MGDGGTTDRAAQVSIGREFKTTEANQTSLITVQPLVVLAPHLLSFSFIH